MPKSVTVKRKTSETDISIQLNLYGKGKYDIKTGIAFLDHMLSLFAKHGLFDLKIKAKGDLDVDIHHTNEDVAITLGEAFSAALRNCAGIKRFGDAMVPMDEALARAVVDISGRPYVKFQVKARPKDITDYSFNYLEQFLRALSVSAKMTIHLDIFEGRDMHHVLEASFKALGRAFMKAVEKEPRAKGVPSTKGKI